MANPFLVHSMEVSELIEDVRGVWKEDVIHYLFNPLACRSFRLCGGIEWVWHYAKDGQFSVKTAYRLDEDCIARQEGGRACFSTSHDKVWKLLWNGVFHVCSNSLFIQSNLLC